MIENNVCYHTSSQPFHQHYGQDNIVRNNIFALGGRGQVALSRDEGHSAFTLERNIVPDRPGQPIFVGGYAAQTVDSAIHSDRNLFWTISGKPLRMTVYQDFDRWQDGGQDPHSLVADPLFTDPQAGDFTLSPDSPAFALGFKPIDLSTVGVRPTDNRNT